MPDLTIPVAETTTALQAVVDLWPDARVSLTIHGVPHELIHSLAGDEMAVPDPAVPGRFILSAHVNGWTPRRVGFFGVFDDDCARCCALADACTEWLRAREALESVAP